MSDSMSSPNPQRFIGSESSDENFGRKPFVFDGTPLPQRISGLPTRAYAKVETQFQGEAALSLVAEEVGPGSRDKLKSTPIVTSEMNNLELD
ncbi:hypothetical protein NDU88_003452 [Pleurodeles waltl]|uniref:Uncharacterized protein n=1 Tax=Pleurodeles waltl TaxID=8319 RepID=A0AAV7SG84_PLEWA|nr:hypothetical protein NDU88_003452 [Pleurodeles waltl]